MRKRRSREEATDAGSVPTAARRSPHRGRDVRGYVGPVRGLFHRIYGWRKPFEKWSRPPLRTVCAYAIIQGLTSDS